MVEKSEKLVTRSEILDEARQWLGTPYVHQASCLSMGCDCLGLVRGVWRGLYGAEAERMPNYSADWAESKAEETLYQAAARWMTEITPEMAKPGDVVLFRWRKTLPAKHIAIVSSPTSFIHACEGVAVSEVPFHPWWRRRMVFAFQFPDLIEE